MYTNNREAYRQAFFTAWQKHQQQKPLEPIETQLVAVMLQHPDHHRFLDKPTSYQSQEFSLEENPFFHMSLHVAIAEQIQIDRPPGIRKLYQEALKCIGEEHQTLHEMMAILANIIWEAQQNGAMPDEAIYLERLKVIIK